MITEAISYLSTVLHTLEVLLTSYQMILQISMHGSIRRIEQQERWDSFRMLTKLFDKKCVKLSEIWRAQLLKYISRISRHNESFLLKTILSRYIIGKRNTGQCFCLIKDVIFKLICLLIPSLSNSGCHNCQFG